jgi:N-hydroxyarylamine O-acetyltransferase
MKALRILVVEDDVMIGMLLAEMLKEMGHDVCAIEATEADAVTAAVRCRPDLIVDAWLGDGSGVAAVEKIRSTGSIPHLFVSGDISRVKALRPGAVVVQKPFREADLARAIQRALDAAAASCCAAFDSGRAWRRGCWDGSGPMSGIFNFDAYLVRIGYTGPRTSTLPTLQSIHALHPAAIPFENLDPLLRRPVRLDLGSLQAKLVGERRGGYCFEQNTLLAAALEVIGFSVTRLAGRVRWMAPPERLDGPRTHMVLRVDLGDGPYLVDVGFGGHLSSAPIRLERGIAQQTPASVLRLMGADQIFTLQTLLRKGWQDVYRFTLEPQLPPDYELANWFTSTNPASLFYANLLLERLTPECRFTLSNARLTRRHASGAVDERTLASAEEFADTLETTFGITPPIDATAIWQQVPKGG